MRIFKYFAIATLLAKTVWAADGQALYDAKCKACHGFDAKVRALGKSNPIFGSNTVEYDLLGYRSATLNKYGMGAVMKGIGAKLSNDEIKALASFLQSLPSAGRKASSAYAKQSYAQPQNPYANMTLSEIFNKIYKEAIDSYPKPQIKTELTKGEFEKQAEFDKRVAQTKKENALVLDKYNIGIDERHTYAFIDDKATTTSLTDKLDRFIRGINDGDTIYFYYSGHGIPSPTDGEAYFLPKDKVVDYVTKEKELMASKIYQKLSTSKASKVVAFVDACFSGRTDNKSNLKGVAAGVFKSKAVEFDKNKMVVISAGSSKQFSNSYNEKEHRMFSYFLMKNLLENYNIDLDLLYKKTAVQVKEASFKKGDTFVQEPQIEGNNKLWL